MAEKTEKKSIATVPTYTPDPSYKQNAWVRDYSWTYREFISSPDEFWGNIARELEWYQTLGQGDGMEVSLCQVVCEWKTQHHL